MTAPILFDRDLYVQRRDRAAPLFDGADFLLTRALDDLTSRLAIVQRTFTDVACVGAFTGAPGRALRTALSQHGATVTELDPSQRMLAACDGPSRQSHEDALPFEPETLDCVVAPLTLQFVNDLPGALIQIRRALRPDGFFLGAMTGGTTLAELADAFALAESEVRGGASPRVAPRVEVRALGSLLQRAGFALPVTDIDTVTVTYPSPLALMRDLRAMGATNCLTTRSKIPVTRGLLARVCEIYADRHALADGRFPATFEILTMTGWAPHPDQPKPLRPGSATHRLADALGVTEYQSGETTSANGPPEKDGRGK